MPQKVISLSVEDWYVTFALQNLLVCITCDPHSSGLQKKNRDSIRDPRWFWYKLNKNINFMTLMENSQIASSHPRFSSLSLLAAELAEDKDRPLFHDCITLTELYLLY